MTATWGQSVVPLNPLGGHASVNLHPDVLVLNLGANYKTGATTKPVNELHRPMLPEFSPLPRVRDALQKLGGILGRNCWPFEWLRLAFQDDDRRLADAQPQLIRSI
jgi:hypothetical protein